MTPELWQKVKDIFQRALDLDAAERPRFVADMCAGDGQLRREVEALLAEHEREGGFTMDTRALPVQSAPQRTPGTNDLMVCRRCGSRFDADHRVCPDDGEVLDEDPEALLGATVDGSYRIERFLGRGGMGSVYLAEHVLLRDRVALKLLSPEYRSSAERLRRFLREGRLTRAVRHPNVVAIHELRAPADGPAYMVLEYVEGSTLAEELRRRRRLSPAEAVAILEPVASALDHAHANGLLHRDLKPENIMVGEGDGGPVVKVLDLGIAKLLDVADVGPNTAGDLTMPGQIVGTPSYMSPEQWGEIPRDGRTELDGRADVYSLGAVAFEMLAGRRIFQERTLQQLRRAHTQTEPPALADLVEGIEPAVSAAIARALAKDRADRQTTAGELVAEMKAGLAGADPSGHFPSAIYARTTSGDAAPPTRAPHAGTTPSRSGTTAAFALLLASTLAGGLFWISRPGAVDVQKPARAAPPAPQPPAAERTLHYSLFVRRAGRAGAAGEPLASPESTVFRTGDGVRVLVTCPEEGFLYVVNEAPTLDAATALPRYTVIFPGPFANGGSARVAANQRVRLLEREWIEFGGASGTDLLWLVWSARSLDAFDGVGDLVNPRQQGRITDPARVEAVRDVLAGHRVSAPEAQQDVAENRTTLRGRGDVLVHSIQFEHQ